MGREQLIELQWSLIGGIQIQAVTFCWQMQQHFHFSMIKYLKVLFSVSCFSDAEGGTILHTMKESEKIVCIRFLNKSIFRTIS